MTKTPILFSIESTLKHSYLIGFLSLFFLGCKSPIKEFRIPSHGHTALLKVYADSSFSLESETGDYSGVWTGKLQDGDTLSIMSTMNSLHILTNTPKISHKIKNGSLIQIHKNSLHKGWKLSEFIDASQLKTIKVRNVKGLHELTVQQWKALKPHILNAKSVGGLHCKPNWLALIFEYKNGRTIEGSFCGDLINFEDGLSGSFRIAKAINMHNY